MIGTTSLPLVADQRYFDVSCFTPEGERGRDFSFLKVEFVYVVLYISFKSAIAREEAFIYGVLYNSLKSAIDSEGA